MHVVIRAAREACRGPALAEEETQGKAGFVAEARRERGEGDAERGEAALAVEDDEGGGAAPRHPAHAVPAFG